MTSLVRSLVAGGSIAVVAAVAAPARAEPSQVATPAQTRALGHVPSEADGVAALLDDALSRVALRPEQGAALESLRADLGAKAGLVVETRRALLVALGPQIAAGSIDVAAVEPHLRAFLDASVAAAPASRAAVQQLHETLDPVQRERFVAGFERALGERSVAAAPSAMLERWTRALSLDEWQQRVLRAILDAEAVASRRTLGRTQRMLAAFGAASFRIDEALPKGDARARAEQAASELIEITALVTEVLTPAQRTAAYRQLGGDGFGAGFASGLGGVHLF